MKEVDCRKCRNCDKENKRCRVYGNDSQKAVERCAANWFAFYYPTSSGVKMDGGADHED